VLEILCGSCCVVAKALRNSELYIDIDSSDGRVRRPFATVRGDGRYRRSRRSCVEVCAQRKDLESASNQPLISLSHGSVSRKQSAKGR
jgi:hypothetical protein